MIRRLGPIVIAALLSGCANFWTWIPNGAAPEPPPPAPEPVPERPPGPNEYVVHKGDTLYSIAFRNQLDYRDVAKWNGIGSNYLIYPGQVLRLTSPTTQAIVTGDIVSHPIEIVEPPPARPVPIAPVAGPNPPPPLPKGVRPRPIPIPPPPASPPTAMPSQPGSPVVAGGVPPVAGTASPAGTAPPPGTTTSAIAAAPTPAPLGPAVAPPPPAPGEPATPFTSESGGPYKWQWPTNGTVFRGFNPATGSKGLDFAGSVGQPVVAAAPGKVVYSGAALKGYGELIIIKHDDLRLSAYGYNRARLVEEGEMVRGGQKIAELGLGPENKPALHFEIREKGQPVNPAAYLPAKGAKN